MDNCLSCGNLDLILGLLLKLLYGTLELFLLILQGSVGLIFECRFAGLKLRILVLKSILG